MEKPIVIAEGRPSRVSTPIGRLSIGMTVGGTVQNQGEEIK